MQDVVVSREQHQHQHKRQSDTETKLLRTLRQRLSANRLHRIEQKVSAIQKRHRKQVQQADGNREDGRKVNQGRKADGGHLAGDLGDPDRAADLIGIPWQILIGPKGLAEGKVEIKRRSDGSREFMSLDDAINRFAS